MLSKTSKTSMGIPAVYYRYISRDIFKKLLKSKKLVSEDYINEDKNLDTENKLNLLLNCVYYELITQGENWQKRYEEFKKLGLEEKMIFLFPSVDRKKVNKIITNLNIADLQRFFSENIGNEDKRLLHKEGLILKFSNMLSASAGGPIWVLGSEDENLVYIEFIAPDDCVNTHGRNIQESIGVDEDKEVFFKKIPLECVSKVYFIEEKMVNDILGDNKSAINVFADKHKVKENKYLFWRRNASTSDMVPMSIAKRINK